MVEAGEGGMHLVARYAEVAGQCGERVHGPVTQPDHAHRSLRRDGAHVGRQRVAVVDHEGTGCELGHVPRDRDQFGHVPQRSQHAARPYAVAHGLRDTMPGWHLDVVQPAGRGADGDRRGDEARAGQRLTPVGVSDEVQVSAALLRDPAAEPGHGFRRLGRQVHQMDGPAGEDRRGCQVGHQSGREYRAARAD